MLGALFASLAALSVRVFAGASDSRVSHLRVRDGRHEVDIIAERNDHRVVAFEVKLSATVDSDDASRLVWLRKERGDRLLDAIVLSTGSTAYRREDGVAVVPLGLLGP